MDNERPQISVILLCYREGEKVRTIVPAVQSLLSRRGISYELIVIGNYNAEDVSRDVTPSVVRDIAKSDSRIIAVTEAKRGMFGWDVKSGLARARGETVTFIDGDGQMPFEDIVRVYDALVENHADYAQTYRVTRHDGLKRLFVSRVYNALLRLLFPRVTIYDGNAKPKIFTHDALNRLSLTSDNWFIDAEIVIQACYAGFKIAQIPTVFHKLQDRSSLVNAKAIVRFLCDLIRYRLRYHTPEGRGVSF